MSEQSEPFYYITVEPNREGFRTKRPWYWFRGRVARNSGVMVNDSQCLFYNVDTWFSPASAERNPDRPAYWQLRSLKVFWGALHKGRFRIRMEIPPGDYFIESNCVNKAGEGLFFVERLQVSLTAVIIDIYKNGNELVFHMEQPLV